MLGKGYGRETCNPAGRYLREVLDAPARKIIALMWKEFDEDVYEIELDALGLKVIHFVEEHPEIMKFKGEDFWNWKNPREDVDNGDDPEYEF